MSRQLADLSELQLDLHEAVRVRLEGMKWFAGVFLDDFPSDEEIRLDYQGCIAQAMLETAMWDDPEFYTDLMASEEEW